MRVFCERVAIVLFAILVLSALLEIAGMDSGSAGITILVSISSALYIISGKQE
jgi:hypothetical protein